MKSTFVLMAGLLLCASIAFLAQRRVSGDVPKSIDGVSESAKADSQAEKAEYETETLRGHVGWLADSLEKRFGIITVPEAKERVLAMKTVDGAIVPLVEDTRGRAFRNDPRLRGVEVELLVRRFQGSPAVQVIRVFALEKGKKFELDYWCDICSITMFELKTCECCQGPIELRKREVK